MGSQPAVTLAPRCYRISLLLLQNMSTSVDLAGAVAHV